MALSQIVASLNYLSGYNNQGDLRALDTRTNKSLLFYNGQDVAHCDGGDNEPIALPSMAELTASISHLVGMDVDGRLFKWKSSEITAGFLTWNGTGFVLSPLADSGFIGVPSGAGVVVRQPGVPVLPATSIPPTMLVGPGLVHVAADGTVTPVTGTDGQILRMSGAIPTWVAPDAGSAVAGAASVGMSGVSASSTGSRTLNLQAPSFELTDGIDATTALNVNQNLDLDAVNGIGGLDAGAVAPNTWYYVYVVSNETLSALTASLSGTAPDQTNLGAYDFYSIASIVRTDGSSNIVPFAQRGRSFHTRQQIWGTNLPINRDYAIISPGINLNTLVPPSVKEVSGIMGGERTTSGTSRNMVIASDANGLGAQFFSNSAEMNLNNSSTDDFRGCAYTFLKVPILNSAAPVLYWKMPFSTPGTDTTRRIVVTGYTI